MYDGEQLKYGWIKGGKLAVPVVCAAQTFVAQSGRFIYMNAGAATQCVAASTTIWGWLESEAQTVTAGEELNCIIDLTAVFRLPASGTNYAASMIGDYSDLDVSASVQSVTLGVDSRQLVLVVGGNATDADTWVDVIMNPAKFGTGIAAA